MPFPLDPLEERLQTLIEESLSAIVPWGNPQRLLTRELVGAMRRGLSGRQAPTLYTLTVHPSELPAWQESAPLLRRMADTLAQAGRSAGYQFAAPPVLRVTANDLLAPGNLHVEAQPPGAPPENTTALEVDSQPAAAPAVPAIRSAFLVLNGAEIFPLTQPVLNVGRKPENHIVLPDPRVSRQHAQLRLVRDRYVVFDLNSTGGTFVNGERVSQAALKAGDVISFAGVDVVYGEDQPTSPFDTLDNTQAMPFDPPPAR